MTATSLPFSSSTLRSSASAYLRPSWKMWPDLDAAGERRSPPPHVGARVAGAHLGGLDRAVGGEVAARDEVDDVLAGLVGAGDPAGARRRRGGRPGSGCRLGLAAEHPRPDVALDQLRVGGEVLVVNASTSAGSTCASRRLTSTSRSPGTPMTSGSLLPSGWIELDDDVLQRVGGGPRPVVAPQVGAR